MDADFFHSGVGMWRLLCIPVYILIINIEEEAGGMKTAAVVDREIAFFPLDTVVLLTPVDFLLPRGYINIINITLR